MLTRIAVPVAIAASLAVLVVAYSTFNSTSAPLPTATATPPYVIELSDYISALGERYQRGLGARIWQREFENYGLVYVLSVRLRDELWITRRSFMAFVASRSPIDVARTAGDQINELSRRHDAGNREPWLVLIVDPDNTADSTIACRLALVAAVGRMGSFAASQLLPSHDRCPVIYAEYVANRNAATGNWLNHVSRYSGAPVTK